MIDKISLILRDKIKDIAGIHKISGNVYTVKKSMNGEEKKMPVSDTALVLNCEETGELEVAMIPDSDYQSVSYFEPISTRKVSAISNYDCAFSVRLRYVWWGNLPLLGEADNVRMLPALIQANIIKMLCDGEYLSDEYMRSVKIEVSDIPVKSEALFSKYSYNELVTQYLKSPYAYFAIDFEVYFEISDKCFSIDYTLNPPLPC